MLGLLPSFTDGGLMKKLIVGCLLTAFLSTPAIAISDSDIIISVREKLEGSTFPKGVVVNHIDNLRFFPGSHDSGYSREGNACGIAKISKAGNSATLAVIYPVKEDGKRLSFGVPELYDMDKQSDLARPELAAKCK
jgi:hypothetical protein